MAAMIDPKKSSVLRAGPRLMQILRVLARHKFLSALRGRKHWPPPKDVREAFDELGLVFLKFGQVLAMRHDLLPAAYIKELELLHDELPAMGIDAVRANIEAALGKPLVELFQSFDETPLAAATIAPVHAAKVPDRRAVASAGIELRKILRRDDVAFVGDLLTAFERDIDRNHRIGRRLARVRGRDAVVRDARVDKPLSSAIEGVDLFRRKSADRRESFL